MKSGRRGIEERMMALCIATKISEEITQFQIVDIIVLTRKYRKWCLHC